MIPIIISVFLMIMGQAYVPVGATRTIQPVNQQCNGLYSTFGCIPLYSLATQAIQVVPDPDARQAALNYCLAIPPAPGQNPPTQLSCANFVNNRLAESTDLRIQTLLDKLRIIDPIAFDAAMTQVNVYQKRIELTILPPISVTPTAPTPQLSGSIAAFVDSVDLTSDGTIDWVHFASGNHKMNGTAISAFTTPSQNQADYSRNFKWTDGTPATTGSSIKGLTTQSGAFSFIVAGSTTPATLKIYVSGFGAGTMTVHMVDSTIVDYVDSSPATGDGYRVYIINFTGQSLTVKWAVSSGNINIQAATLR